MKSIIELLKEQEPLIVCAHHDADGITSAVLLATVFNIEHIHFPDKFGDYMTVKIGEGEEKTNVALDLGPPLEPENFEGVIIDHHPQTKELGIPNFSKITVVYEDIPTSAIVYKLFKDKIPKKHKWKVVCGTVGDGQPEKTPLEIWKEYPELLETRGNIYQTYGKYKEYPYPIYKQLSSPINASCTIGNPETAFEILLRAEEPLDVIHNPALVNDKELLNEEIKNIFREGLEEYNIRHYLAFIVINSNKRLASRICSSLASMNPNKTWIVVNKGLGDLSIRGDQASYIGSCLQEKGIDCGGHYGYYGGDLKADQTEKDVLNILRKCLV